MSIGRLGLRTVIGGYFIGHAAQFFGYFGGEGIDNTAEGFAQLGLRPPKAYVILAAAAMAGSGAALVLGAGTPLAGSVLIATMVTAIRKVHGKNGPWGDQEGYEYNLVLIFALAALAESGPGSPSIDDLRGNEMCGPKWATLALSLGAAGAFGVEAFSGGANVNVAAGER